MTEHRPDPAAPLATVPDASGPTPPGTASAPAEPPPSRRLHGLDALRAFAMLLGIGLHAALAFLPGFWPVQDNMADFAGPFDEFFLAVHGFRMPIFFLMSGFFTAMLWRRRGLGYLINHRLRRIALPLLIGLVTVIPVMNLVFGWAIGSGPVVRDMVETGDVRAAALAGNIAAIDEMLERGADINLDKVNEYSAEGGTALHLTAFTGNAEVSAHLLAKGADPNALDGNGDPPINWAIFFGRERLADLLVSNGAQDPRPAGTSWEDISYWNAGAEFAPEPQEEVGLESWLVTFHHLWFLWFLLWLVAGFALVALAADARPKRGDPAAGGGRPSRALGAVMWLMIPLTLVPQLLMGGGGEIPVFGPDTSIGWVPLWHVLAYYALFFTFGALLYGRTGRSGAPRVETLGKRWWAILPATLLPVFFTALFFTYDPAATDWLLERADWLPEGAGWLIASILQVLYAWGMCIGLIGLFRAALRKERATARYLSDASYWMYIAHLPLIIVGQVLVRDWNIPAIAKFLLVCGAVSAVLLVTYQFLIRYTPVGTLLNGKRERPARRPQAA